MNKHILSVILAAVITATLLAGCATPETPNNEPIQKEKTFAADTLLSENGNFGNDSEGTLCVGFIGGSLTDAESYTTEEGYAFGGKRWTDTVVNYLEEKFPNRKILPHNAGIGGTTSDYGAARITETILKYAPDIVFIEYTVNDSGFSTREDSQKYMESMVRMSQQLDKIPVVIFLYTPYPTEKDSNQYIKWEQGKNWKQEIADYYGLGSIDIYDYMYRVYENTDYPTFLEFILNESTYGGNLEVGFDVHGGYEYYADSIIEALDKRTAETVKRPDLKDEWFENGLYKDAAYMKYDILYPQSDRFSYEGSWRFVGYDELVIPSTPFGLHTNHHAEYTGLAPQKRKHGVMATDDKSASFSFITKADAVYISDMGQTSYYDPDGILEAAVYVDGEYVRDFVYDSFVLLAELDGGEHTVTVKMTKKRTDSSRFLLSYITEAYKESSLNK